MTSKTYIIVIAIVVLTIAVQALVLFALGREAICHCGYIKIWDGTVKTPQNSQHFSDWYSTSHLIYGFIIYFAGWFARSKFGWPLWKIFLALVVISAGWEIFENTQFVVEEYRNNPLSAEYHGDSVLNSVMDTVSMMAGFYLAWALPVWAIIAIAVVLEISMILNARDGVLISATMSLHSFQFIRNWQAALSP